MFVLFEYRVCAAPDCRITSSLYPHILYNLSLMVMMLIMMMILVSMMMVLVVVMMTVVMLRMMMVMALLPCLLFVVVFCFMVPTEAKTETLLKGRQQWP
jgi:hypothetical protein